MNDENTVEELQQLYAAWLQVAAFSQKYPRGVASSEYRAAEAKLRQARSRISQSTTASSPVRIRLRQERGTKNMELLKGYVGKSGWVVAHALEFIDFEATQSYVLVAGVVGGAALPHACAHALLRLGCTAIGIPVSDFPNALLDAEIAVQKADVQQRSRQFFEREAEREEDAIEHFISHKLADCELSLKASKDSDCNKTIAYWQGAYAEASHELTFRRKRQIMRMQSHLVPKAIQEKRLLAFEWTF